MSSISRSPSPGGPAGAGRRVPILGLLAVLAGAGCATLGGAGAPLVPSRCQTRTGPYVVFTNAPLPLDAPAVRQLQALDRQVEATLGVRADPLAPPIEIYILDNREAFSRFLTFHYPEFPPRRAFFLAQGDRRVVYTFLGDRLEEDLRHEATHALLHAAVGAVPLWLDEGLAEYFEGRDDRGGVNPEHLGPLPEDIAAGWAPDLRRLEGLKDVRRMSPRDYREAWAWTHFLLHGPGPGKATLLSYLADLRTAPEARPLSERLDGTPGGPNARLLAHLERVREHPLAAAGSAREPIIRLQGPPAEPPSSGQPRRGLLGRVRDAIGSAIGL
jgi:hypothetical protein